MSTYISNFRNKIDDINSYLLIAFAFFLPLTVAGGNFFAVLIFLLWLIKADFKNDYLKLKNNKVVIAVMLFLALHVVGLLWTSDLQWGLHILKKELKFLWLPIFMLFIKKEHIKYYIGAFLLAMAITEVISYLMWFDIIPIFGSATSGNPTPFMSHITYNPFLTIAIYLVLYNLLFNDNISKNKKLVYLVFFITMSVNMFITGGRGGQVMYFTMLIIVIFQYFNKEFFKSFISILIIIPSIFIVAYNSSDIFQKRVNAAVYNIKHYELNKNTSVGLRLTFAINSWEIIKENPIIGVGTGDYLLEYRKINDKNTKGLATHAHPHNMYILELVQFGILGLIALLLIGFYQLKHTFYLDDSFMKKFGVALPLLFGVIMFSDSYLLGHYTTLLFIFFSSILYKDYNNES